MKSDKKQLFADIVCFDLIIQKRRGKIQTGKNHVHQGLSKVFVLSKGKKNTI